MTKFTLTKSGGSNNTVTKFDVLDATGAIVGRISVPPEDSADLQRHWLGGGATQPKAAATKGGQNPLANAMLNASKRPGALAPNRNTPQNPMVARMVATAKKHPLTTAAILRGC
jgi:hypothetical protein